jgi:hypothetical protein
MCIHISHGGPISNMQPHNYMDDLQNIVLMFFISRHALLVKKTLLVGLRAVDRHNVLR